MTGNSVGKIGGLLLAAGASRRFGSPKQLARFEGQSLLRRAAESLVRSSCEPIVVVLGAEIQQSSAEIADLPINIQVNQDWQLGMSSSIKSGLVKLRSIEPGLAAVIITLCDQPRVTAELIELFSDKFRATRDAIIAAEYGATNGVPALFSRAMFVELLNLTGDKGARDLIRGREDVSTINLEEAQFDIDSPGEL